MASETTGVSGLAARYAAALFDIADERRMLDEVASDLRELRAMLAASVDLSRLVKSPILTRGEQGKAISTLAERAGFSPLCSRALTGSWIGATTILVAAGKLKPDEMAKSYDFFRNGEFFEPKGNVSKSKLRTVTKVLQSLGDLSGNIDLDKLFLPGVNKVVD